VTAPARSAKCRLLHPRIVEVMTCASRVFHGGARVAHATHTSAPPLEVEIP